MTMGETTEYASVRRARELVLEHVRPGPVVRVPLRDGLHRWLAEPVVTDVDYPPFDKAMMDGYAVCWEGADVEVTGGEFRIVGQVAAGEAGQARTLGRGEAMQINTGAPIPAGTDAVVRVEDTRLSEDGATVQVSGSLAAGMNIDGRAKYVSAGAVVLEAGTRMTPGCLAVAAAAGAAEIAVYRVPRVAILVTGNELVDPPVKPSGGQIRNSNGPMLAALVRDAWAEPIEMGVIGDDRAALRAGVERGLSADILCVSGGVSMGAFDFVPEILTACGVRTIVRKLALKPGKPSLFGMSETGTCVFGLPGNPIGSFVAFWLLVRLAIEARQGQRISAPEGVRAALGNACTPTRDRETYWPAKLTCDERGGLRVTALSWHGSGDPFGFSRANGLIVRPPNSAAASEGDEVMVIPLERL